MGGTVSAIVVAVVVAVVVAAVVVAVVVVAVIAAAAATADVFFVAAASALPLPQAIRQCKRHMELRR